MVLEKEVAAVNVARFAESTGRVVTHKARLWFIHGFDCDRIDAISFRVRVRIEEFEPHKYMDERGVVNFLPYDSERSEILNGFKEVPPPEG